MAWLIPAVKENTALICELYIVCSDRLSSLLLHESRGEVCSKKDSHGSFISIRTLLALITYSITTYFIIFEKKLRCFLILCRMFYNKRNIWSHLTFSLEWKTSFWNFLWQIGFGHCPLFKAKKIFFTSLLIANNK